ALKTVSNPGESERDFKLRLQQIAREQRDQMKDDLRNKYAPKVNAIQERIRRAEMQVDAQAKQATASKWQTAISFGATILGAVMGRATTSMRGVGRTMKESSDVTRAEENVGAIKQRLDALEAQMNEELAGID